MGFIIYAACLSNKGRIRSTHEDNFFFDGKCLEQKNEGLKHPVLLEKPLNDSVILAVFDGMGGENYGEVAAFSAAEKMKEATKKLDDFFVVEKKFLEDMSILLNQAVVDRQKELCTEHMGTTMTALYFTYNSVYACNLGDSRAYRLRGKEFLQLSEDHVEHYKDPVPKKAPLTQYLGLDPEEIRLEPTIAKGELKTGDQYLLCSDGLTDMLSNLEIDEIMEKSETPEICVFQLVDAALEKGGRDNITVIVCRIADA